MSMELFLIILSLLVLLAEQATEAGQTGLSVSHQDGQDLLITESDVFQYTGGSHSEAVCSRNEVTFNGKVPYEDDTEGSQMQSITNEAVANNINDIVDDDHLNEQPNITHSCVSDDLLPDRTGPCQPSSSLAAVSSHLDIGVVTRTVNVHMTDPSSSFASTVFAGAPDAHAIKVTNKRKRRSKRSSKVEDDPELDLNLKSIEENYQEICRLLGKEQNAAELAFLENSIPHSKQISGRKASPITIDVNGDQISITEWSQLRYAKNTLVKLILVARFCQKLDPIWKNVNITQKTAALRFLYHRAQTIMLCLGGCCGNDLIKFQEGRENPFNHGKFRSQRCLDHKSVGIIHEDGTDLNVKDLNLKTIDVNYRDLCRLLEKQEDAAELTRLQQLIPKKGGYNKGKIPYPITVDIDGQAHHITEWSQMRSAQSTVVKLILTVRFTRKLDSIWDQICSDQKTRRLQDVYSWVRAIMFCVQHCCDKNLLEFYQRWGNPFKHKQFSARCCSAAFIPGSQCGFVKDTKQSRRHNHATTSKPHN